MNTDKSTNDIRMIATEVVRQQASVCDVRRESLEEKIAALADTVKRNAEAIASLTLSAATLTATITSLPGMVRANESAIEKLKGRPAVWAAIGAALPTLLGVLLWWFGR